jgi:hypothetical protein
LSRSVSEAHYVTRSAAVAAVSVRAMLPLLLSPSFSEQEVRIEA